MSIAYYLFCCPPASLNLHYLDILSRVTKTKHGHQLVLKIPLNKYRADLHVGGYMHAAASVFPHGSSSTFPEGEKHPTCSVGVITLSVIIRSMISQLINLTDV